MVTRRRKTLISNRGRWRSLSLFRQIRLGKGKLWFQTRAYIFTCSCQREGMLLHACFAALFFAVSFADRTFPVDAQRCAVSLRRMYASLYIDQTNVEVLIQRTSRVGNNKNLSCCRETARCIVLLNISLSHSRSWRRSTFIKWTGWTLAMALPWWQHHKHCHGYYY